MILCDTSDKAMKRTVYIPDELADALEKYLQEHPDESSSSLMQEAIQKKLGQDNASRYLALAGVVQQQPGDAIAIKLNQMVVPPGQSVLLQNVSPQEFENILIEIGKHRGYRIAYLDGILEIMAPLPEHEYLKSAIADLIKELAEELGIEYECFGSTTWRREAKRAGVEPDECFYIQNFETIRGRLDIDLNSDPPPDLVLEIDVTLKSIDRLPIYARLSVPEVWRYIKGELKIYHLAESTYVEAAQSLAFGSFPVKEIPSFLRQNLATGRAALRQNFRVWVKQQLEKPR
jgi:Uma2 family endonuclease